jgi:hypothetical protein
MACWLKNEIAMRRAPPSRQYQVPYRWYQVPYRYVGLPWSRGHLPTYRTRGTYQVPYQRYLPCRYPAFTETHSKTPRIMIDNSSFVSKKRRRLSNSIIPPSKTTTKKPKPSQTRDRTNWKQKSGTSSFSSSYPYFF